LWAHGSGGNSKAMGACSFRFFSVPTLDAANAGPCPQVHTAILKLAVFIGVPGHFKMRPWHRSAWRAWEQGGLLL